MQVNRMFRVFGIMTGLGSVVLALAIVIPGPVRAAPSAMSVGGDVLTDTTWTLAGSPYLMTSTVVITTGVTLTIEPGVIVKGRAGSELRVEGRLVADADASLPITFTSELDSGAHQWGGLLVAGPASSARLRNCTIRYGAGGNSIGVFSNLAIRNSAGGEVIVGDCTVRNSYGALDSSYGIWLSGGRAVLSSTSIMSTGIRASDYPLYYDASSVVTLTDLSFQGNFVSRILHGGGALAHDEVLQPFSGVSSIEFSDYVTVPTGITLTVLPGTEVRVRDFDELTVRGHLSAIGEPGRPITFTSVANTAAAQWAGLVFNGGTGELAQCTVRYGGGAFVVNNHMNSVGGRSSVTARNVTNGQVSIRDCAISDTNADYNDAFTFGLDIRGSKCY